MLFAEIRAIQPYSSTFVIFKLLCFAVYFLLKLKGLVHELRRMWNWGHCAMFVSGMWNSFTVLPSNIIFDSKFCISG